jgi:hypothetical protein
MYGTQMVSACGVNFSNACQAAVIAPVIAAKLLSVWTVRKSLTAGLSSVPVDASSGDSGEVVVLNRLITGMKLLLRAVSLEIAADAAAVGKRLSRAANERGTLRRGPKYTTGILTGQ